MEIDEFIYKRYIYINNNEYNTLSNVDLHVLLFVPQRTVHTDLTFLVVYKNRNISVQSFFEFIRAWSYFTRVEKRTS